MLLLKILFFASLLVFSIIVGWWISKLGAKRLENYRKKIMAKTAADLDFLLAEIEAETMVRYTLYSSIALGGLLFFISSFNLFFGIIGAIIGSFIPRKILRRMAKKKLIKFDKLLPEVFTLISSAMRAGNTLVQALQYSIQEIGEPYRGEMQRVMNEYQLGVPIQDSLEKMANRIGSKEFSVAVVAIKISLKTGSNLTEVLEKITETMINRNKLLDKIQTITQEARMQAYMLIGFPVFMLAGFYFIDPNLVLPLFTETIGLILLGFVMALEAAGYFVMKIVSKVEV